MNVLIRKADGSTQTVPLVPGLRIAVAPGDVIVAVGLSAADVLFALNVPEPGDLTVRLVADGSSFVLTDFLELLHGPDGPSIALGELVIDEPSEVLQLVEPSVGGDPPGHAGSSLYDVTFDGGPFGTEFRAGPTNIVLSEIERFAGTGPDGTVIRQIVVQSTSFGGPNSSSQSGPTLPGDDPTPPDESAIPLPPSDPPASLADLDGTNGFRLDGAPGSQAGFSVSGAGDVNGDGFDDMIVGAKYADGTGAAYVVFGKATAFDPTLNLGGLDGTNGFKLAGEAAGNLTGFSVSSAGDVNGDGFEDLMVGAPGARPYGDGLPRGASYVVFGHDGGFASSMNLGTLDGENGFRLVGRVFLTFPYTVGGGLASADWSGDGYDDLVLGGTTQSGGQDFYLGWVRLSSTAIRASDDLAGRENGLFYDGSGVVGTAVSSAGDIDGDGFEDVIMGASHAGNGALSRVFILFGGTGFPNGNGAMDDARYDGRAIEFDAHADSLLGASVASAGDVNGDGFADVIFGAPGVNGGRGAAYVVLGTGTRSSGFFDLRDLDGGNGFRIDGAAADLGLGFSVASAGDVNGDGLDDLIVGAKDANGAGVAYVLYGRAGGYPAALDLAAFTAADGFRLVGVGGAGITVQAAGDANGDGFADLIAGAPGANGGGSAYVIYGGDFSDKVTRMGTSAGDLIAGTAGADIIAGLQGDDTLVGGGGADVLNGGQGTDLIVAADLSFQRVDGGGGNDTLRIDVGGTVDLHSFVARLQNVEGLSFENGMANALTLDRAFLARLDVQNANVDGHSSLANTLTIRGDVGDMLTLADGFVGGWRAPGDEGFKVYSIGGFYVRVDEDIQVDAPAPPLQAVTTAITILEVEFGSHLGWSVSGAGDVNGDGFDDVIFAAPHADINGTDSGAAYVLFGSAVPAFPVAFAGELTGSFGFRIVGADSNQAIFSVSSAGDVNHDGFADIIVGTRDNDANGADSGAAYVLFGKAGGFGSSVDLSSLDGTTGFRLTGAGAGEQAGFSVSDAGDVNGDGIADLIVGAPGGNGAYVVFGRTGGFAGSIDLGQLGAGEGFRLFSTLAGDDAGIAVSAAGDFNGDGFGDLIVGAPGGVHSYIVLGRAAGFSAGLDLAALDGSNGFAIRNFDGNGLGVSSAGDVNGDGFDDVIVATLDAVYVVYGFGGTMPDSLPLVDIQNGNFSLGTVLTGSGFQSPLTDLLSVSAAGDVNGDGIDDLLIGAPLSNFRDFFGLQGWDGGYSVVYGKAGGFGQSLALGSLDADDGFTIRGELHYQLGTSVSAAGDVNGDGYADLVIGAAFRDGGFTYVVFGGNFNGMPTSVGSARDEIFDGTAGAERIVSFQGDDTLNGNGGADVLEMGHGDDTAVVSDLAFVRVDGGGGSDTLRFDLAGTIDLSAIGRNKITGVESISVANGLANTLVIDRDAVFDLDVANRDVNGRVDLDNVLIVHADAGDTIDLQGGWVSQGADSGGAGFTLYTLDNFKVAVQQGATVAGAFADMLDAGGRGAAIDQALNALGEGGDGMMFIGRAMDDGAAAFAAEQFEPQQEQMQPVL